MAGSSGGGQGPGGTKKARIEIIPLIDVIFFLLATFVLFTISLNKSGGLPSIALPSTHSSEPRDPGSSATISIRADGTLGWDKEPITLDQFLFRLEAFKKTQPDGKILINGDENALFQQVRYVIDEVRKAGLRKVHIETRIRAAE